MIASSAALGVAMAGYGVASTCFGALLLWGKTHLGTWAHRALLIALIAHVVFLASDYWSPLHRPALHIHHALAWTSLLMVVGYVLASTRHHMHTLGAFVVPLSLVFLAGAAIGLDPDPTSFPASRLVLSIHVGLNIVGIALLALAFAIALAYILQEKLLRRRQLGGMFQHLPPLETLDRVGLYCVGAGFISLTMGILLGIAWILNGHSTASPMRLGHSFAIASWVVYASVLALRLAWGWRGRRAALGTVVGFLCALVGVGAYWVRAYELS